MSLPLISGDGVQMEIAALAKHNARCDSDPYFSISAAFLMVGELQPKKSSKRKSNLKAALFITYNIYLAQTGCFL